MTQEPKIVAIIQARMSSSRLPGKVLKEIGGVPMLAWVAGRARKAQRVSQVVVATTTDPSDDPVVEMCRERGIECFRGNLFDVLDRYYQTARHYQADVVVRLTADCPLLDPALLDETVKLFFSSGADFAANRLPPPWTRTYPIGLDVEVVSFAALERAWKEAKEKYEREHVLPYLYDTEGRFKTAILNHDPDYGALRWTVDTPEDLEMIRQLVALFAPRQDFTWQEALEMSLRHPELAKMNAGVHHKSALDLDDRAK